MKRSTNLTPKNSKKKLGLDLILSEIKSGLNPAKIVEKYNIPKTTLDYSLGKLKNMGCIKKIGYGTWEHIRSTKEVPIRPKGSKRGQIRTSQNKEIRGHAFIWKIEFAKAYDWKTIAKKYKKKTLNFQLICRNTVPRTIFKGRKIWLTKKGMTIYEPVDFFGKSSFAVKGTAVFEMDKLLKELLSELGEKFRIYRFTTSREHYAMIKNELARQFNDRKEKLAVRSENGTVWLWIDDSKGMSELETADPNNSRQVQNFWNNHKKHKFKHDGDYIDENFKESAKQIKENADNIGHYAKNMVTHVALMKGIKENLGEQTKVFQDIRNFMMESKKNVE